MSILPVSNINSNTDALFFITVHSLHLLWRQNMDRILWEGNSDPYTSMSMGQTVKQAIADIRSQQYKTLDSPLLSFQHEITLISLNICIWILVLRGRLQTLWELGPGWWKQTTHWEPRPRYLFKVCFLLHFHFCQISTNIYTLLLPQPCMAPSNSLSSPQLWVALSNHEPKQSLSLMSCFLSGI